MSNKKLYIVISILSILVLLLGGYIIYDKVISNSNKDETKNDISQDKDSKDGLNKLTGKINFSSYCPDSNCKKEIGYLTINNQDLKLAVDLQNLNTDSVSGKIFLGTNELDISELSYIKSEKIIDGFEVYNDYLILYMSNLEKMKSTKSDCEVRGYMMYVLNSNLDEVTGLAGYTKDNAFSDFKFEDDLLYYYALSSKNWFPAFHLIYEKINFNDLINKNYDNSIFISSTDECSFGD